MANGRVWTEDEEDVVRSYASTMTHAEIGNILGRTRKSVMQKAHSLGAKGRPRDADYGRRHGNWRGGYLRGSYGKHWERVIRPARLRLDGYMCQDCSTEDETGVSLNVHHVHLRRYDGSDDLTNLVSLCGRCHGRRPEHREVPGDGAGY